MLRGKSFLSFVLYVNKGLLGIVAESARRVSCLKFELRVSNFPVIESEKADSITAATMGSPFYFLI